MKQFFLRTCLSAFALQTAALSFAFDFEEGGIGYGENDDGESVSVISLQFGNYSGDVIIPSSVTYKHDHVWKNYSVTSIGDGAFSYCDGLTSIKIPSSVTSIGYGAFSGCTGLTSIDIPSSVTAIGKEAFRDCTGVTSIDVPSSVNIIRMSDGTTRKVLVK